MRKANAKTWFHRAKSIAGSSVTSYCHPNWAGENGLSVSTQLRVDGEGLHLPLTRLAVLPTLEASSMKHSSSYSFDGSSQDRSLRERAVPFHPSSWGSTTGCENCLFSVREECPAQKVLRRIVFSIIHRQVTKAYNVSLIVRQALIRVCWFFRHSNARQTYGFMPATKPTRPTCWLLIIVTWAPA